MWFVKTNYKSTACFLCAGFRARPRKTSTHASASTKPHKYQFKEHQIISITFKFAFVLNNKSLRINCEKKNYTYLCP